MPQLFSEMCRVVVVLARKVSKVKEKLRNFKNCNICVFWDSVVL